MAPRRGPVDTGVDAGRTALKRAEPGRPGRVRVRSLAARAAAVLLAAVAALLVLPLQAQAQTEVWSGTLTVRDIAGELGCINNIVNNFCSVHLSDDDFTHDSTDYAIVTIFLRTTGQLQIGFDTDLTTATQALTLNIDGTAFAFEDADVKVDAGRYWNNSGLSWTAGGTVSLTLTEATTPVNNAPDFGATTANRSVAENTAAGQNVGAVLTATDDDNDTLTYTLEGADAASFDLFTTSGSAQIRTKSGVTYDHETKSSYAVTVKADDLNGGTDTVTVTINLTDVDEPPLAPAAPTVTATPNTTDSLSVSWRAPSNTGRPAIDSYDLQYREGTTGNWTNGPQNQTATSATITGLTADPAAYQVQVRATNDEGDGRWSPPGRIRTTPPEPSVRPPSIPRNLRAEPGDRQVTLSWRAPSSDGSSPIVRYEYRLQVGDGAVGKWQIIWDRRGEESHVVTRRHSVVGLDNGTSYTFQLRAVNNRWASPATESVSATPEPEPVPALPLLGQLLLALGLAGAGAMRLARATVRW